MRAVWCWWWWWRWWMLSESSYIIHKTRGMSCSSSDSDKKMAHSSTTIKSKVIWRTQIYDRILLYGIFSVRCCLLLLNLYVPCLLHSLPAQAERSKKISLRSRLIFVCVYRMVVYCMLPLTTTVYRSIRDDRVYGMKIFLLFTAAAAAALSLSLFCLGEKNFFLPPSSSVFSRSLSRCYVCVLLALAHHRHRRQNPRWKNVFLFPPST